MSKPDSIIFSKGSDSVTVKIREKYTTILSPAIKHAIVAPTGVIPWDNGIAFDGGRICKCTAIHSASESASLLDFMNDVNKARGQIFTITLSSGSGFFPFGPDHGDTGVFTARLIVPPVPTGVLEEPYLYSETELQFVEVTKPAYALPAEISEGDLAIGTISNLRFPPAWSDVDSEYGYTTRLTNDGTPSTIDKTSDWDDYSASLRMVCNQSKAAALIDHMMSDVRGADVTITAQANNYIFGVENSGAGAYTCKWMDEVIEIQHVSFDRFLFALNFYRESQA